MSIIIITIICGWVHLLHPKQEYHFGVGFDDFLRALSITGRGTKKQRVEYLFQLYDADQSGGITIEEFSTSLKLRLKKIELTSLENIFYSIDTDRNGVVDQQEFVRGCESNAALIEYLDLY